MKEVKRCTRNGTLNSDKLVYLIDQYGKDVYKFCYKLTKNREDADDLYQDTFLKAVEQCHKIDENINPKGYLISISVFLWKSYRRKLARRYRIAPNTDNYDVLLKSDEYNLESDVITNELICVVSKEIDELKEKFRIPLYMYYTIEMSVEEIAISLKIPAGTVKSRLYKARKILKNKLEAVGYE